MGRMRGPLVLLSTRSMTEYTERVAYQLQTFPDFHTQIGSKDVYGRLRTARFADGEMEVEILNSVRGSDVFLFSNAGRNDAELSVEENKLELYHAIDALRRAQAGRITLVEPYCSASRSDRTTRRNSVGFWVHYKTLASLGLDHFITYQLHSDKSRTVVDPMVCAIDDVPAVPLIQQFMTDTFVKSMDSLEKTVRDEWLFCSVDAGGEGVARQYARAFGTKLVIAHKQRNYHKANTVESITILTDSSIEGKDVWIVDDMIDTAGSVFALVQELSKRNVRSVNIAAIHPVFSEPALDRLQELYGAGILANVVVTDTLQLSPDMRESMPYLHVVSSARLSAEIVMRLHEEATLSPFFDPFNPYRYLSSFKLFM
jgi:ribose-phosphate pyrophosphokinase